eukprot:14180318-Heterocapsa_arctica.AAC.3
MQTAVKRRSIRAGQGRRRAQPSGSVYERPVGRSHQLPRGHDGQQLSINRDKGGACTRRRSGAWRRGAVARWRIGVGARHDYKETRRARVYILVGGEPIATVGHFLVYSARGGVTRDMDYNDMNDDHVPLAYWLKALARRL